MKLFLRLGVLVALVAGGAALLKPQSIPGSAPNVVAAAPRQTPAGKTDLGNGFSASTDGNATVITTPCPSGILVRDRFPWAPYSFNQDFDSLPPLGSISNSTYRFTSTAAEVLSPVYRFGCKKQTDSSFSPAQASVTCLILSQQGGAIKPTAMACPISTWQVGEVAMFTPELQLARSVGTTSPMDGVGGRMGLGGCAYGDTVTLSLDDKTVPTAPVDTGGGFIAEANFVLPLLQSGTHTVRTSCTYSTAGKPAVAQKGACISVVVADGTITSLKQCPGGSGLANGGAFELSTNTTLEGVCGGYGFVAQKTSATGVAQSLVATVKANQGDQATIAVPAIDPIGYVVANCYTNLAGTEQGPLQCYQVVKHFDQRADPSRLRLSFVECPFTNVRSIDTL